MAENGQGTKRKHGGGQDRPSKKPHHDNSHSRNQHLRPQPVGHGLPPLPNISEPYLNVVFTHPTQNPSDPQATYDRLEFLGDAYIELYASQLIFDRSPNLDVGKLSQIRESLVRNETIGQYATLYGLDKQLKNYKHFQNGQPTAWLKIKGDIFEAYVAAIILSTPEGPDVAKAWLHKLWEPKLQAAIAATPAPSKKAKETLAKKILMGGVKINYVDERPPVVLYGQGKEEYLVGVYFNGWQWENQYLGSGKGFSRNEAGQVAAEDAMRNPLTDKIAAEKMKVLAEREAAVDVKDQN